MMKMFKKSVSNIILILLFLTEAQGQEIVTGLQSIPAGRNKISQNTKSLTALPLELPFFDDFSGPDFTPDITKWNDDNVFINNTYTDRQITTGVATFDAIDNTGRLYETASVNIFEADKLTSLPINLEDPSNINIWLSFYYQPGGLVDFPEKNDSLTLQFYAPDEDKWYHVWKNEGYNFVDFKPVIIRISHSRFLKKEFRFRFINYASLSPNINDPSVVGNCDYWNIDYVKLDRNRNDSDTLFADVAFRYPNRSLLKTHEAMPWKQFQQILFQEMGSAIPIHYRNNDNIVRNVTRNFEILDVYKNSVSLSFSAGATNIEPHTSVDYDANLIYTFDSDFEDSALFRIKSWLITDEFDPKENDTTIYYQRFSNYFAFDDGSSEAGYGINGLGSRNAMAAYRFRSFIQDTIRAIRICFNDSYLNANRRAFDLMIWDDNNGIPGNLLYSKEDVLVEQGDEINGFHTYKIPSGVMVDNIFYVGWKQRSETFLNAGLDLNTSNAGRQYYWINGSWSQSQVPGSLMIRPVTGAPLVTSVNDILVSKINQLRFWPNPAKDKIYFDTESLAPSGLNYISIFDLTGRELIHVPFTETIDISSLHEGVFIIISSRNGKRSGYGRLIKKK